jgi:hypothetical protein
MIYDTQKRISPVPATTAISDNASWGGNFPSGDGWGRSYIENTFKTRVESVGRPFCKTYILNRKYYLLGGVVTGGSGNITVPDLELAIITSGVEWAPDDGTHHWLRVSFTAYAVDDVLFAGGDVTAVTDGSGKTVPDNTIPTYDKPEGVLYISLGSWLNGLFNPAACGNIQVNHCTGSLGHTRTGEDLYGYPPSFF